MWALPRHHLERIGIVMRFGEIVQFFPAITSRLPPQPQADPEVPDEWVHTHIRRARVVVQNLVGLSSCRPRNLIMLMIVLVMSCPEFISGLTEVVSLTTKLM